MAEKTRNELQQFTESKIYDNDDNEIVARFLRETFKEYRDSHFNRKEDEMANLKFNSTQTLQEYLDERIGRAPLFGQVSGLNIGDANQSLSPVSGGIISSASVVDNTADDTLYEINFNTNIADRRLIPLMTYTNPNWNGQNDIAVPVVRRISSTKINVAIRQVSRNTQDLILEIIAI